MRILFVCLGNICRSPLADAVMRDLCVKNNLDWTIDSAGTSNYHIGEHPDKRAQKISQKFGVDSSYLKARQFSVTDYDDFDVIYAMDQNNYNDIIRLARNDSDSAKVKLFLNELEPGMNRGVRDPWFDDKLFEPVFVEIRETCEVILFKYKSS
ncbi:MAG: low molecular weight protein-tyrosine-phosphatase [bacterium]|jgi:protein-tyrosine phosphatase